MTTVKTRQNQTLAPIKKEAVQMTPKEAKIRISVIKSFPKPPDCIKTDIKLYKFDCGRINHWVKGLNGYDIGPHSAFFIVRENTIEMLPEQGEPFFINFS